MPPPPASSPAPHLQPTTPPLSPAPAQRCPRSLPALLLSALLGACASVPPPAPDPLEGRIFAAADGSELDQQALRERMLAADVVYLGEIHDNPHHHAIQEQLLDGLVAAGASPALALEAVGSEQTGWLMDYAQPKAQKRPFSAWRPVTRFDVVPRKSSSSPRSSARCNDWKMHHERRR